MRGWLPRDGLYASMYGSTQSIMYDFFVHEDIYLLTILFEIFIIS